MFKRILKYTLLFSFDLVLVNEIWGNLVFLHRTQTVVYVAAVLTIFELFLKPVLKILLLPVNLLTLGSIRVIINTLGLYLAVFILTDFRLRPILISSFNWQGFTIPDLRFVGFWSYLTTSLTLGLLFYFFNLILEKKN